MPAKYTLIKTYTCAHCAKKETVRLEDANPKVTDVFALPPGWITASVYWKTPDKRDAVEMILDKDCALLLEPYIRAFIKR